MDGSRRMFSVSRVRSAFGAFFYARQVPYGLAIVRILLPAVMLIPMLQRWPRVRELYSLDGATAQLSSGYGVGELLPVLPGSVAVALFSVMIFCLFCGSIGWYTRVSLIVGTSLLTYFNLLDCVSTITKYSCIAIDAMLVLCLSNCGSVWSVDSRRRGRVSSSNWPGEPRVMYPRTQIWPTRLIQFLIGFVYFGSAITKMQTSAFFSGEQMRYWMLSNFNFDNPVGETLALHPTLLVAAAYVTVVWEMLFLFVVWRGWRRIAILGIGVFFHAMTCLTLGLYIFPMVCVSVYFAFLTEDDVRMLSAMLRRLKRRNDAMRRIAFLGRRVADAALRLRPVLRLPAPVVYTVCLTAMTVTAVEAEYRLDLYGLRRPEGPYALTQIDPARARQMITAREPVREQDKFFSFRTGTVVISGILANDRNTFHYGERLIAQCSLNPPHGDLWVECNLHDDGDRVIERVGVIVTRESMRGSFYYNMRLGLESGDYQLVFRSSGTEVGRRRFTLTDRGQGPLAN